jgi:hypothetical protein
MFDRQQVHGLPATTEAKWNADVLDEGFVPLPKRLLRSLGTIFVGSTAIDDLRAVLAVVDYRRPKLQHPPSLDYLAFIAGLSNEDMTAALDRLRDRGLITIEGTQSHLDVGIEPVLGAIMSATSDHPPRVPSGLGF